MKKNKKRQDMSLRAKYSLMLAAIIMACFLLLGVALVAFAGRYWYGQKAELMTENTHNVAQSASDLLSGGYISMYGDGEPVKGLMSWSQAKYAMEIFASMLDYRGGNGDKLTIYTMWPVCVDGTKTGNTTYKVEVANEKDIDKIKNMY